MALRGYELILFVRAQNQASATLRRVATDVRALSKATDLQQRAQDLATAKRGSLIKEADLRRKIASFDPGGKAMAGIEKRQRELVQSRANAEENIRNLKNDQKTITENIARAQERGTLRGAQLANMENLHTENRLKFLDRELQIRKRIERLSAKDELSTLDTKQLALAHKQLQNLPKVEERVRNGINQTATAHAKAMSDAERDVTKWSRALDEIPGKLRKQLNTLDEIPHKEAAIRQSIDDTVHARQMAIAGLEKQIATTSRLTEEELANARAMRIAGAERQAMLGRTIAHAGRAMQFAGIVATALLGGAAKTAADFDTLVTQAATQTRNLGSTGEEISGNADKIRERILEMMRVFPAGAEEMAESAYDIFSSMNFMKNGVVDVAGGLDFLAMANQVAVAGQLELKDATNGLITIFNSFGQTLGTPTETLDTLFNIIRFGRVRMSELNTMMIKVAPASRIAGQSLDQVAAALSLLTSRIPSTSVVATGFSRVLEMLGHPDTIKGLRKMGVEITKNGKALLPFNEVVDRIINRFPELERGGLFAQNFFRLVTAVARTKIRLFDAKGEVRDVKEVLAEVKASGQDMARISPGIFMTAEGRRSWATLVTNIDEFRTMQGQVADKQGAFNIMLKTMMDTPGVKWKVFVNTLRAFIITLGDAAIPVFAKLGGYLNRFLNWINNLDSAMRNNLLRWTAWGAVGLVLVGTIASIAGSIIALIANMRIATAEVSLLRAGFKLLGLVSLFVLVEQLYGIQTAIIVATAAWALFRKGGIGAALAVALANKIAARQVQIAWSTALVRTGWGAILIAAGFAIEWIVNNMDKVRSTWAAVSAVLPLIWANAMEIIKMNARDAVIFIAQQFTGLLGKVGGFLQKIGGLPGEAGKYLKGIGEIGKLTAGSFKTDFKLPADITKTYMDTYNKSMADIAKGNKGKANSEKDFLAMIKKSWNLSNKSAKELVESGQLKELQDLLSGLGDASIDGFDKAKQAADAFKNKVDEVANALMSKFKELEGVNRTVMGDLFQGPFLGGRFGEEMEEWGIKPRIQDLTKDMRQQIAKFRQFRGALAKLRARGAPPSLINALLAMGPDAIDEVMAIANAPKAAFNEFTKVYAQREAEIKKATMVDFSSQLAQWKKYGGDIIDNILSGLNAEDAKLKEYFRNMATNTFGPEIMASVKAEIARQTAAAGTKTPTVPGTGAGANDMPATRAKGPRKYTTPAHRAPQSVNYETNITVHAKPGEDVKDTGRRAVHQWQNAARKRRQQEMADWGIAPKPGD